jgi:hypothetical protein
LLRKFLKRGRICFGCGHRGLSPLSLDQSLQVCGEEEYHGSKNMRKTAHTMVARKQRERERERERERDKDRDTKEPGMR